MEKHLGEIFKSHRKNGNTRKDFTPKTLKTDTAEILLEMTRVRNADIEPQLVRFAPDMRDDFIYDPGHHTEKFTESIVRLALPVQMAMPPFRIVEWLNIVEYVSPCFLPIFIEYLLNTSLFQT